MPESTPPTSEPTPSRAELDILKQLDQSGNFALAKMLVEVRERMAVMEEQLNTVASLQRIHAKRPHGGADRRK